jgi:type VI protein secretion system component VasK
MHIFRINSSSAHYKTPLVVRASLPRTFWSLGAFVELGLIFCGVYLLAEASLKPLEADQTSILSAGVILALAIVLLFYMVRPRRKQVLPRPDASRLSRVQSAELRLTAYGNAVSARRVAGHALQKNPDPPGPM